MPRMRQTATIGMVARRPQAESTAQKMLSIFIANPGMDRTSGDLMKKTLSAEHAGEAGQSPNQGWRVSLNRLIWRAHIFTAGALVVWVERVCPNRGYGQRIFSASARLTNRLVGIRVEVIGLDKLDPEQAYVFTPNHRSHVDITALMAALPTVGSPPSGNYSTSRCSERRCVRWA